MSTMESTAATSPQRTRYRVLPTEGASDSLRADSPFAALDGLRGLAVTGVVLASSGWTAFGSLGIDVFFVITGFLITLMLLRELQRFGRIDLGRYLRGRAKRIAPAGAAALVGVLLLTWQWGALEEMQRASAASLFTLAQIANWGQLLEGGSFAPAAGIVSPLGHAWALSITAQFLIAWPFVMILLWKVCRREIRRVLTVLLVILTIAAAVAPVLAGFVPPDRILLGTDTRFVAFAAGAAAAAYLATRRDRAESEPRGGVSGRRHHIVATGIGILSLIMLVAAGVLLTMNVDFWLYRGGLAAVAGLTALAILCLCTRENVLVPLLSWGPLAALGRQSFGIFLFHLPVIWFLQRLTDGSIAPPILFVGSFAIAWILSFSAHYVVTLPLARVPWSVVSGTTALAVSAALVVGLSLALPLDRASAALEPRASGRPVILTVGDSLVRDFASMISGSQRQELGVSDLGRDGCGLIDSGDRRCDGRDDQLTAAISGINPDAVLVHASADASGVFEQGAWLRPCDPGFGDLYRQRFTQLLDLVAQARVAPVVLVSNERATAGHIADEKQLNCFNAIVYDLAADNEGVVLLDWNSALCTIDGCRAVTSAGRPLFRTDDVRMTQVGMTDLAPWLEQTVLAGIAAAKQEITQ